QESRSRQADADPRAGHRPSLRAAERGRRRAARLPGSRTHHPMTPVVLTSIGLAALITIVLALVSGIFSASETGLTAASRARMHQMEKEGEDPRAKRVNKLLEHRERLIGALLLGNLLLNTTAAAVTTSLLEPLLGQLGVAVATAVTTVIVLIFAEV